MGTILLTAREERKRGGIIPDPHDIGYNPIFQRVASLVSDEFIIVATSSRHINDAFI